jgi:hypothetical protein
VALVLSQRRKIDISHQATRDHVFTNDHKEMLSRVSLKPSFDRLKQKW